MHGTVCRQQKNTYRRLRFLIGVPMEHQKYVILGPKIKSKIGPKSTQDHLWMTTARHRIAYGVLNRSVEQSGNPQDAKMTSTGCTKTLK